MKLTIFITLDKKTKYKKYIIYKKFRLHNKYLKIEFN